MMNDPLTSINEQTVFNLVQMYDMHFPANSNEKKAIWADHCSKKGKDSVNAGIYVRHAGQTPGAR
jgi:hypothetical protein